MCHNQTPQNYPMHSEEETKNNNSIMPSRICKSKASSPRGMTAVISYKTRCGVHIKQMGDRLNFFINEPVNKLFFWFSSAYNLFQKAIKYLASLTFYHLFFPACLINSFIYDLLWMIYVFHESILFGGEFFFFL